MGATGGWAAMGGITNMHQIISWLGYLAMFAFVAFTILTSLYYIGLFIVRLIRRLFAK